MINDITIPPEALEAAAKAMWKTNDPSQWELGMARAACLAMLHAWPKAKEIRVTMPIGTWVDDLPAIILPLPQEGE